MVLFALTIDSPTLSSEVARMIIIIVMMRIMKMMMVLMVIMMMTFIPVPVVPATL